MNNQMTIFDYEEQPVRVTLINDEPWWVLADVCRVLEIQNPTQTAQQLDEDERAMSDIGLKSKSKVNVINESGLYKVLFRSDKPHAKAFTRWLTHEVLPHNVY